jgi:hypothetical protein
MANQMRWRYGDTAAVMAAVASETVIDIGDIVYLDTNQIKPASALADAGTKAGNQEALHDKFLGVALQRSRAGDVAPVRVATSGVFEFDCPSATFELGNLLGVSENGTGDALLDQQVESVATCNLAIGRCVRREPSSKTTVLVQVQSTVLTGGPQVMA